MSSFLTFTLIHLKNQLLALSLELEQYPERRPQIEAAREAIENAMRNAILRTRAEAEAPRAIKH